MTECSFRELMNLADSNLWRAQRSFEEKFSWKRFVLKDLNSVASKIEFVGDAIIIIGHNLCFETLKKFGNKITLMTIDFTEAFDDCCEHLENNIIDYCTSSLLHLKLVHVPQHSNLFQSIFSNLQTLELQYCTIADGTHFNVGFPNLRRLIFTGWNKINQDSMKVRFLALRELITTMYIPTNIRHFNITMATFVNIRSLNPNLSTSIITAYDF